MFGVPAFVSWSRSCFGSMSRSSDFDTETKKEIVEMIDPEGFTMKFTKQRLKNHFAQMKQMKRGKLQRYSGRRLEIIEDCMLNDRYVQTMLLRGKMSGLVRLATKEDLEKINEKETSLLPSNPDGLEHVIPEQLLELQGRELTEALKRNYSNQVGLGGTYMAWDKVRKIWRRNGKAAQDQAAQLNKDFLAGCRLKPKIAANFLSTITTGCKKKKKRIFPNFPQTRYFVKFGRVSRLHAKRLGDRPEETYGTVRCT